MASTLVKNISGWGPTHIFFGFWQQQLFPEAKHRYFFLSPLTKEGREAKIWIEVVLWAQTLKIEKIKFEYAVGLLPSKPFIFLLTMSCLMQNKCIYIIFNELFPLMMLICNPIYTISIKWHAIWYYIRFEVCWSILFVFSQIAFISVSVCYAR